MEVTQYLKGDARDFLGFLSHATIVLITQLQQIFYYIHLSTEMVFYTRGSMGAVSLRFSNHTYTTKPSNDFFQLMQEGRKSI